MSEIPLGYKLCSKCGFALGGPIVMRTGMIALDKYMEYIKSKSDKCIKCYFKDEE